MQRAAVVVQPEKQGADRVGNRFVPSESSDDAVGGAGVLDLEHRAFAGFVGCLCRLGNDTVKSGSFEAFQPLRRDTALACLIVVTVWKEAGFFMIFYLAALQAIAPALAEAASIEGAGRWYFFRRVTFPLLMPTTLFVLVNAVINSFRLVDHVVVMTRGGPDNASSLLLYYIYDVGFKFWDTGYAAALTMVLLVILASMAIGQFLLLERRIHYR